MAFQATGVQATATLEIRFTNLSGNQYAVSADSSPTLTVYFGGSAVTTVTNPTNTGIGDYEAPWTPSTAGEYTVEWSFTVDGTDYTSSDSIFALDPTPASSSSSAATPDVGGVNTCAVTGTFITSAGNFKSGVYVRFSPDIETARRTGVGFIIEDVTATSGADGEVSFNVVRGITGLLSISGTDLVRRVTIPDQSSVDLFDLASTGDDLLEVQELELIELPRRS